MKCVVCGIDIAAEDPYGDTGVLFGLPATLCIEHAAARHRLDVEADLRAADMATIDTITRWTREHRDTDLIVP